MLQRPAQHVCDNFHVGVRMRWKATAPGNTVVVDDAQRTEAHVLGVEIAAEGEAVATVEPT